jgi:osmotically-inducible protein OsmY
MIRGLLRLIVVVVLIIGAGMFFLGYRWGDVDGVDVDRPVATSGELEDEKAAAREAAADIGETVAVGADRAQRAASEAGLSAKIKAKMALDDRVAAANIDVDTDGSIVTLSGRVSSSDERDRAVRLAKETEGVSSVVDRLTVSR